jgi:hypothetical protein
VVLAECHNRSMNANFMDAVQVSLLWNMTVTVDSTVSASQR